MKRELVGSRKAGLLSVFLVFIGTALLALAGPAEATFPGQNGALAFERFGDVYLDYPGETGAQKISGDGVQTNPAVSPDGARVAYEYRYGIWVMNADGTGQKQVSAASPSTAFTDSEPAWSPEGDEIVFSRYRSGDRDLWSVRLDGSQERDLTNTPGFSEMDPAWSPTGDEISYTRVGCESPGSGLSCVYKMKTDGTGQVNLTPETSLPGCPNQPGYFHRGASSEPSYSSDGAKIAFRGTVTCPHSSGTDIWVMGSGGGGKVNLTDDNGTSDNHPAFSPDGTKVAFNSSRPNGDPVAVYLVGSGGGEVSRLPSSSGFDNDPDWGPADDLAPTVAGITPADSARNVSPRARVTATFSEPMRASTLNDTTFVLRKKGSTNGVAATVGYDAAAKKAWLDPSRDLRAGTTYVVTLEGGDTGAKDLAGNALPGRKIWSFTVKR